MQGIDYAFKDDALLRRALTHSSFSNENDMDIGECNERLEFLGDSVIELIVSDYLFNKYPDIPEGRLTQLRAKLVCESSLSALAQQLQLGGMLRLGHGETQNGGRERDSILSDAFEAVMGAVYLDGGFKSANTVVLGLFKPQLEELNSTFTADPKSELQEWLQSKTQNTAVYEIVEESGPPHDRSFVAAVFHEGRQLGTGSGKTKKEAEQNAAAEALKKVQGME